jgi:hypothetical protein
MAGLGDSLGSPWLPLATKTFRTGGWSLLSPSLDREATEDGVQQQQRGKGKGKGNPAQFKGKRKREEQEGTRNVRARVPLPQAASTPNTTPLDPPELARQTRSQARVAAAAAKKVTRSGRKF